MRSRLVLLGGQTIALGLMMAFLVVPASSVFLAVYGAALLPYTYLCVAVAGVALSALMSRAQRRWSLAHVAVMVLAAYAVIVAAAWAALEFADATWVTFPLVVLFPLSIPVGFVLVGTQAGRLLDVRQMKAHFPRVVAGFSVGFAVGGLIAARLVGVFGGPAGLLVDRRADRGRLPDPGHPHRTPLPRRAGGASAPARGARAGDVPGTAPHPAGPAPQPARRHDLRLSAAVGSRHAAARLHGLGTRCGSLPGSVRPGSLPRHLRGRASTSSASPSSRSSPDDC